MKAVITLVDGKKYKCQISKNNNKLNLNFENIQFVPWSILTQGEFSVSIEPTEKEITCTSCCDTCLTPIC